jgi:hypothetical protein
MNVIAKEQSRALRFFHLSKLDCVREEHRKTKLILRERNQRPPKRRRRKEYDQGYAP